MKTGFTGTSKGMTAEQKDALRILLEEGEFHHGDCVGADAQAHDIAEEKGLFTVSHPPIDPRMRAFKNAARILMPFPYLVRNKHIVEQTDRLIGTPGHMTEQLRSGTWSTIRYALKLGKETCIIFPDGNEHWSLRREVKIISKRGLDLK